MSAALATFRFPVRESAKWTLAIGLPMVILCVLGGYIGNPKIDVLRMLGIGLAIAVGLVPLAVLGLWAFPFQVSSDGIRGWAHGSLRGVTVPWDGIKTVAKASFEGIPVLRIEGQGSKNIAFVPLAIARRTDYRTALTQFGGVTASSKVLDAVT